MQTILEQYLQKGACVLTPTRRLATYLKNQIGEQWSLKTKTWSTPAVICLDDWLHQQWQSAIMQGLSDKWLINERQSLQCIENCIVSQQSDTKLIQPFVTAKLAYQAWRVLHHWRATQLLNQTPQNIDEASFQQWMQDYRQWLIAHHAIDHAQLLDELRQLVQICALTGIVVLYSFEELTPLQQDFFRTLTEFGWEVQSLEPEIRSCEKLKRYEFENAASQYYAGACWAQAQLDKANGPIVIVTTEVTSQRQQIETIFNEVLSPLQMCQPIYEVNPLFNISAAIPLGNYAIIDVALLLIHAVLSKNSLIELATLISSPFIQGAQSELVARAQFIKVLKDTSQIRLSLDELVDVIEHNPSLELSQLLSSLKKAQTLKRVKINDIDSIVSQFKQILSIFGWPGERPLSSVEHQTVHRFNLLLSEMAQLDALIEGQEAFGVWQILKKFAADLPFQAENKNAPIQILGPLEAAGQNFNCLWVMDCDSDHWPQAVQPNPFIPYREQKERLMPHASPERQTDYAKKVLKRFRHSAREVIFSHAKIDQEKKCQVSALIHDVELREFLQKSCSSHGLEYYFQAGAFLESVSDERALPITTNYQAGTQLLAMQAQCPFKAFASIRLEAKKQEFKQAWLQPKEQGIIIHRVLEEFWKKIRTKQNLVEHSQAQIDDQLNAFIEQSLIKYIEKEKNSIYFQVEKKRIHTIVCMALNEDLKRPDFIVKQIEMRQRVYLENIQFNLRIDRVDCDVEGNIIIIDYKTGKFTIKDLWGERITAPQLPLYYLAMQVSQPQALGVCVLKSEGVAYVGIKSDVVEFASFVELTAKEAKSVLTNWQDLNHYWQQSLQNIAQEFKQGYAQVMPLEGKKTCLTCDLSSICRIFEHE